MSFKQQPHASHAGSNGTTSHDKPGFSASSARFMPAEFAYNGHVALALLPCLVTGAGIGGQPVAACLLVGAMVVYLMDSLQFREGAFSCAWATLGISAAAFGVSLAQASSGVPPPLLAAMFTSYLAVCGLTGMWASLQFRWIAMQYPGLALGFERALLTAALPAATIMNTLGLSAFLPASDIPYYLAGALGLLYFYLGRPLTSSFHSHGGSGGKASGPIALGGGGRRSSGGGSGSKGSGTVFAGEGTVQSTTDGALAALLVVGTPALLYIGVHWAVLPTLLHMHSIVLLVAAPTLFVTLLPGGTWWLLPRRPRLSGTIRKLLLGCALLFGLVAFEGRVVFHSFGQYINLPSPWDWIAVTLALFGSSAVALLHQLGALGTVVDVTLAGSFLLICTTAGALAAGIPFNWLPAPLVGACGLALYYDSRSLREYTVFAVGAFVTALWFVTHHFGFLDIMLGSMHLRSLCKLVLAALVPALLVPGLVVARAGALAVGGLLMLQASLICVLEEKLHSAGFEDGIGEVMYPGYLVVLTSVLGIIAARRLRPLGHLTPLAAWVLHSLYGAKLCMLVLPEAALVLPSVLLCLAVSAPLFLYEPYDASILAGGFGGGAAALAAAAAKSGGGSAAAARRRLRLAPWQGWAHALSVAAAVAAARFALFDVVQFALSARPSEGLLLGVLVLALAAGCVPLVAKAYANDTGVLRALAALVIAGVLLLLLQPPLPLRGGARCPRLPLGLCPRLWDERHVPMRSVEDVEAWGQGLSRKEHWPRWLLVLGEVVGSLAASSRSPIARSTAGRVLLSAVGGLLVGGYVALEVVPDQILLQGLLIASSVLVAVFVALLQRPRLRAPAALPAIAATWLFILPLTLLLHAELPTPMHSALQRLFPDSKLEVEVEISRATRASLLGVFAAHALLLAFALKLKAAAVLRQDPRAGSDGEGLIGSSSGRRGGTMGVPVVDMLCGIVPSHVFARFGSMLKLDGAAGLALQRLNNEGMAWVPTVGNICTLLAFVLALFLTHFVTGFVPEAIFMLSPLLLLLSRDPLILPMLSEQQRYFPCAVAVTGYLLIGVALQAQQGFQLTGGVAPSSFTPILVNVFFAACSMWSHTRVLKHLATGQVWGRPSLVAVALSAIPALPFVPCCMADKYLAATGAAGVLLLYFSSKHLRHVGMSLL